MKNYTVKIVMTHQVEDIWRVEASSEEEAIKKANWEHQKIGEAFLHDSDIVSGVRDIDHTPKVWETPPDDNFLDSLVIKKRA